MRRRTGIHHAGQTAGQPIAIQRHARGAGLAGKTGEANRETCFAGGDHRQVLVLLRFSRTTA